MSILLSLLGFGKIVGGWIKSLPWYAFAIVAALGWGVLERADTRHERKLKDNARASAMTYRNANETNYRSVLTLLDVAAFYANQTKLRGKAYADSKSTDAVNGKANDAKRKADASRQSFIEGVRDHATANPTCAAPKALTDALGGL